jgi:hypothetical protein
MSPSAGADLYRFLVDLNNHCEKRIKACDAEILSWNSTNGATQSVLQPADGGSILLFQRKRYVIATSLVRSIAIDDSLA